MTVGFRNLDNKGAFAIICFTCPDGIQHSNLDLDGMKEVARIHDWTFHRGKGKVLGVGYKDDPELLEIAWPDLRREEELVMEKIEGSEGVSHERERPTSSREPDFFGPWEY